MFAREYYAISKIMPLVLANKEVPKTIEKTDKRTNVVLTFLNILVPLYEGITYMVVDEVDTDHDKIYLMRYTVLIIAKFGVILLQIVSATYLCCAINKIRLFVKRNSGRGCDDEINVGQLVRHALAFGLYLLSNVIMLFFFTLYYIFD